MPDDLNIRRIPTGFVLSFLLVLISSLASWRTGQAVRRQGDLTIHTAIVLGKAEQVVRNAIDAEVSVRRYIYTVNSSDYLELFNQSKIELYKNVADLKVLTDDNIVQQKNLLILERDILKIVSGLDSIIAAANRQGELKAKQMIELDGDKNVMDQLRRVIKDIQSVERKLFFERNEKFSRAYKDQNIFTFGALAGAFFLAGSTTFIILRQLRQLQQARLALSQLNESLEQKIEMRTLELTTSAAHLEQQRADAVFEKSRVELLLREINHRIGNNLATVSAFLGLEAANTKSVEAKSIIESARNRILGIAAAQRRLRLEDDMESVDANVTLSAVVDDLLNTSSHPLDIDLNLNIEKINLESRDITSLAIIINELATNALKHGFPDQRANCLTIMLQRSSPGVSLTVKDNGIGFDIDRQNTGKSGLGHTIIERIVRQYGGTVIWSSHPGRGTSVQVDLPKMAIIKKAG
jgi:two-component sensor histidine kinase